MDQLARIGWLLLATLAAVGDGLHLPDAVVPVAAQIPAEEVRASSVIAGVIAVVVKALDVQWSSQPPGCRLAAHLGRLQGRRRTAGRPADLRPGGTGSAAGLPG